MSGFRRFFKQHLGGKARYSTTYYAGWQDRFYSAPIVFGSLSGTLSLVNAGLAEQKGRDKFSWFLMSLILGPLATAYIGNFQKIDSILARHLV